MYNKFRTARKDIMLYTNKQNRLAVGYCDAQNLLKAHNPYAYTCGVYGWNYDVYEAYDMYICTGYRSIFLSPWATALFFWARFSGWSICWKAA